MTSSTYERAVEIKERLNYLEELIWLLNNATNDICHLAAIRDPISCTDPHREIKNELKLDPTLRDKFIRVIQEEQKQLHEEFEAL